jgi:predicted transcriptional regulator
MNRKRSGGMIMERILDVCTHGASKTRIIYQSNLNSTTVKPYLDMLVDSDLIEVDEVDQPERPVFKTTKAGFEFMKSLKVHNDEILRLSSLLAHACVFFWLASLWIANYLPDLSINAFF